MYFSLNPVMKIVVLLLAHLLPFNFINAAYRVRAIRGSESQRMVLRFVISTNQRSEECLWHFRAASCYSTLVIHTLQCGQLPYVLYQICFPGAFSSILMLGCSKSFSRENIENKNSAHAKIRQTAWACELDVLSTMETTAIISAAVCFIILKPQMAA